MSPRRALNTLLLIYGITFSTLAQSQAMVKEWDQQAAMAAVQSVNIDAAVHQIGRISSLGNATATLNNIHTLENRGDWPVPAREAAIYQFTQSLAGLPRDAIAREVIQYLKTYQPLTLVPHEDHGDAFVPLFNIRGAATGVENSWQRSEFASEAFLLIRQDPASLVNNFQNSTQHNQRSGYLDALRQAMLAEVIEVQQVAIGQLSSDPGLTPMVGATAAITADHQAIEQLLVYGQGAGLSTALVRLSHSLPLGETASLLDFAIHEAPVGNAALAIAAWWPRLSHDPATRELMMATLSTPDLGASAALALAQDPDIQTIRALQNTASGESIAARRAQMALDINRDGLTGQVRP